MEPKLNFFLASKHGSNAFAINGKKHNIIIEHYIISSGLKEMIEGTVMAQAGEFEKIYASSFYFDDNGIAKWPAQAVNYTNKTQFLFRIEKGFLDINDPAVNDSIPEEKIRVPFRNIVYIGDSETDIPCMKLVSSYGGHSICVYNLNYPIWIKSLNYLLKIASNILLLPIIMKIVNLTYS